jgi:hypothetical protein
MAAGLMQYPLGLNHSREFSAQPQYLSDTTKNLPAAE